MPADVALGLTPRAAASSIDELIAGATERRPLVTGDGKSGSVLELIVIDGERFVLKHLHPDADWTMRGFGDLSCRPIAVWTSGLLDAMPSSIDHAVVGAAAGLGRNGWGGALLLHDVGTHLFPAGDEPISLAHHRQLLQHLAEMCAAFWEPSAAIPPMLSLESRWSAFGPTWLQSEQELGWPDAVPRIAADGWARFAQRAPRDVAGVIDALRQDLDPLVLAARDTPQTFLHGDWKLGNLGADGDRTILLDWTYPGVGPANHDLAWYLALNRARMPESKEEAIDAFRVELERCGIATDPWWDTQVSLCLLGALVQFGWEKALGDDDELGWWCDRAREGAARL
ncbi:MAG: phosphotransferase [Microthrixaceae bacterium]